MHEEGRYFCFIFALVQVQEYEPPLEDAVKVIVPFFSPEATPEVLIKVALIPQAGYVPTLVCTLATYLPFILVSKAIPPFVEAAVDVLSGHAPSVIMYWATDVFTPSISEKASDASDFAT